MKFRNQPEEREKRMAALIEELNGESDRAAAIVGAAWVEEALSDAIKSFMQPHPKSWERLFSTNGPLTTFSGKIDLVRLLGIVTDAVRSDLHIIREIRNEFAHHIAHKSSHAKLSFETAHLRDKCLALNCISLARPKDPRAAFTRACATLNSDFDMFTLFGNTVSTTCTVYAKGVDEI